MKKIVILIVIFVSSICWAEIYKWTDEKGGVHFTDDPATIPETCRDKAKSRQTEEDLKKQDSQTNVTEQSIEKVFTFPENYVGRKLVFPNCQVHHDIEKAGSVCNGCYSIGITSMGGKYVSPIVKQDGITFVILKNLAEQLANDIQGGFVWPYCNVSCVVLAKKGIHIALIYQIDVHNMGGRITKTYRDKEI
jgi:hypothetical protein